MSARPLVIYHGACRDGFCAAWCIWRRHPGAEFVAANYGEPPPDVDGRDVIVVDFSYSRPLMDEMFRRAKSLLVLDHHKTAEEALRGAEYAQFDMNRSGAGMAWDHFLAGHPRPWIVDYVEDRDLWRFRLPESRAVNEWLSVIDFDFEAWDREARNDLDGVVSNGCAIQRKTEAHVQSAVQHARTVTFEGHDVPLVNVTSDISEIVGKLAESAPFAIGWFQLADGRFVYSLRSRGDFDVSTLAKKYGGGGHKNAAGFQAGEALPLRTPETKGEP